MTLRHPRHRRDPDHRRHEHQAIGLREGRVLQRIERVARDERAAIRVADEEQRAAGPDARPYRYVAHAEPDGGIPVAGRRS